MTVAFTKWDGSLHWHHTMEYLGEDEHGIWLGARAGTASQRGSEPPITMDRAYVGLFAFGEPWWVAYFNAEPGLARRSTATSRRHRSGTTTRSR